MAAATITRRNLVKGAALGTAAVAALGSTAALADETAPAGVEFAEEYDVVVLGMGGNHMASETESAGDPEAMVRPSFAPG